MMGGGADGGGADGGGANGAVGICVGHDGAATVRAGGMITTGVVMRVIVTMIMTMMTVAYTYGNMLSFYASSPSKIH